MNDPHAVPSPGDHPPNPTPNATGRASGAGPVGRWIRRRWLLGGAGVLVVALVAGAVVVGLGPWRAGTSAGARSFPLTPLPPSPFLNTGPEARYVGSGACRSCHKDRHASFRRTGMGRSMAEVEPASEPPDAVFDHPASKRRYEVRRRDGQLWHRELLLAEEPEVVLAEYPIKYVVGSGHHSRTYLAEAEGFLVESPVTWYTSRRAWDLSPGYDSPRNPGFMRPVDEGCLYCHAGQSEAVEGSLHRMHVAEAAIGCERCHGPGSLHLQRHKGPAHVPGREAAETDHSIVNPARLPRDLAEAVCQQCHLQTGFMAPARGRWPSDYRPGLPLQDFRQNYVFEAADGSMTVVGHVEQLHRSRCYQASDTLTCSTCHNPHNEPRPERRVAHYRKVCLDCHRPERCKVDPGRRQRESPDNDCVHCHMPQADTEIPHLAFTHHRIGIHVKQAEHGDAAARPRGAGELHPFLDLSRLGDVDRERSLGLGYLAVAGRERDPSRRGPSMKRAWDLLSGARKAGLEDPVLDAALARLGHDLGRGDVLRFAESALADPDLKGPYRCDALFLLADARARQGRLDEAIAALQELTHLRRKAEDWVSLASLQRARGLPADAIESLAAAVRIDPRAWQIHRRLAEHYGRQGDAERAAWHERRAVP